MIKLESIHGWSNLKGILKLSEEDVKAYYLKDIEIENTVLTKSNVVYLLDDKIIETIYSSEKFNIKIVMIDSLNTNQIEYSFPARNKSYGFKDVIDFRKNSLSVKFNNELDEIVYLEKHIYYEEFIDQYQEFLRKLLSKTNHEIFI